MYAWNDELSYEKRKKCGALIWASYSDWSKSLDVKRTHADRTVEWERRRWRKTHNSKTNWLSTIYDNRFYAVEEVLFAFRDRHWCYINYTVKHSLIHSFIRSHFTESQVCSQLESCYFINCSTALVVQHQNCFCHCCCCWRWWCLFVCECGCTFFPQNSSCQNGTRLSEEQLTSKVIAITIQTHRHTTQHRNWMWSLLDTPW